jgi:hypothetical protein
MHALSRFDQNQQQESQKIEAFTTDPRKAVKNNLFYGSLYQ